MSQMGTPEASLEQREFESDGWRKEPEALKPEIELIKSEVRGRGLVFTSTDHQTQRKTTRVNDDS